MLFNSFVFLHFFLPVFLLCYFVVKDLRVKNGILLVFSLFFYAWGEDILVLLLLLSAVVDFSAGQIIEKGNKRLGLALSLVFNLSALLYFKYINFFIENINDVLGSQIEFIYVELPIGISFFTFQTMSYTIDVYRGKIKASHNFLNFASYVCMFPQLIAGPIVRYAEVEKDLVSRTITWDKITQGVERFIIGLAKKMIIANYFAVIANDVFSSSVDALSFYDSWLGILAYSFQIFFDFSAYSDMAIGLGLILGFNFPENFNYPYIAKSIKEFWRRWHMTMSFWFRDYVYVSLGGNRVPVYRNYINLFIVFVVTGFWHGASWNFIVWGLIHGFVIVLERLFPNLFNKIPDILRWFYTIIVVMVAWVFFKSESLEYALTYTSKMFSFHFDPALFFRVYLIDLKFYIMVPVAVLLCTPIIWNKIFVYLTQKSKLSMGVYYSFLSVLFLLSLAYLATDSYDPFIYFRF